MNLRRNQVVAPSLEADTSTWLSSGGATLSVVTDRASQGDASLKIEGLNNNISGAVTGPFNVTPGERWEVGVDLLGEIGDGSEALNIYLTCYDDNDVYAPPLTTKDCGPLDDASWQRYTMEALIPEEAVYALFFVVKLNSGLVEEQTTYVDGALVSRLPTVTYFAEGIAELRDSYDAKPDGAVPATADTGQTWTVGSGNESGGATPDPVILGGQLTSVHTATSLSHVQTELDGPVTRIGAKFKFEADDGEDGPTLGILVLNDRMFNPPSDYGPTRSYPNMPCHLAITPTHWWYGVVDEDVDAVEQIAFGDFNPALTPGQEYEASVVLEGDTAHFQLPDGVRRLVQDSRIETWAGPFVDFEPIQGTSRSGFTEVWADSEPVEIAQRLDYADGDTDGWQWEGPAGASISTQKFPPILQAVNRGDDNEDVVRLMATSQGY